MKVGTPSFELPAKGESRALETSYEKNLDYVSDSHLSIHRAYSAASTDNRPSFCPTCKFFRGLLLHAKIANASCFKAIDRMPEMNAGQTATRIYAIGQVHCDLRSLDAIDARIRRDQEELPAPGSCVVLQAGGLIDKGVGLPALMERLHSRTQVGEASVTYLAGAHEELFARTIKGDRRAALLWLLSGAEGSLARWNVPTTDWVTALPMVTPKADRDFLLALPSLARIGETRFVCSTYVIPAAMPFGLFGTPTDTEGMLKPPKVVPIGRGSELMRRSMPPEGWTCRAMWSENRLACAVLERTPR